MTGERFARLRALVEAGHELAGEELARFLDAECSGDAGLRGEALELIEAARASAALFEPLPASRWAELIGAAERRIGGFRVLERIASGGMGTVFAAEQDEPRRRVALKMLRLGFDAPDDVKRFRREAEILSRLHHPHVAQVFAAGVEKDPTGGPGLPWYAMEFVEGARTLSEHAGGLSLDARLALFATLCRAVQHAHERGVIHRDLKPGNVLVDRTGALKVIDFGVAAVAGGPQGGRTRLTRAGTLLGTLDYMPPERLRGRAEEHDTRGDVYSLGVMLYELVSGRLPHDLGQLSLFEAAEVVGERAPAAPSSLARGASRDLDAVVQKALARERGARYASAEALADDVERVRRGEPVEARPPTVLTQVRSLARRHRLLLSAATGGLIALLVGLAVSVALLLRAVRAEREARAGEEAYRRRDYVASIAAAHGALRTGDVNGAARFLGRTPPDLRGFEWEHLHARTDRSLDTWPTGAEVVEDLVWLADGERVAVALRDGRVELRGASGERLAELVPPGGVAFDLAARPGGAQLAVAFLGGEVRLLPAGGEGVEQVLAAHERAAFCLAFSDDGERLATGGRDGKVRVWSLPGQELVLELDAGKEWPSAVAFLPGGKELAVGQSGGVVFLCDARTGARTLVVGDTQAGQMSEIAVSADGALLAAAHHQGQIRVWRLPGGEPVATLFGHAGIVERIAFAPQGALLASAGRDRTIRFWDADAGEEVARLLGHKHEVTALSWSNDGSLLGSGDESGRVKLWARDAADVVRVATAGRWEWCLGYPPDGSVLASLHGGFAELRDPGTGHVLERIPGLPSARRSGLAEWRAVAFDAAGRWLALGDDEGWIRVSARGGSGAPAVFQSNGGRVLALCFSADGERLAAGGAAGKLAWFTPAGTPAGEIALAGPIEDIERSAAGALAVLSAAGDLVLFDLAGTRQAHRLPPGTTAVAWCGEERLAIGTLGGAIHLFDVRAGAVSGTLSAHRRSVEGLAASPDGTRLASCSLDRSIRLFDLARGLETWVNDEHDYVVLALAFAPDGRTLASGSADGTLRLWDTRAPRRGRLDDPGELATVAWMSALAPECEPGELAPLAEEVRRRCAAGADPALLGALAALELALDRPLESLGALERRLALAPETPELLLLRAIALGQLGRRDEALAAREQARALAGPRTTIGLLGRLLERSDRSSGRP